MGLFFLLDDSSQPLEDRIEKLEEALSLTLAKWQESSDCLQVQYGDDVLGQEMWQLMVAGSDHGLHDTVSSIDLLIKSGDSSSAVRRFRDATECTWDDAHRAISHWPAESRHKQLRVVRLTRYLRLLAKLTSSDS